MKRQTKLATVPLALAVVLIAACGNEVPRLTRGPMTRGTTRPGCLWRGRVFRRPTRANRPNWHANLYGGQHYDLMSFNSGCYQSIKDGGGLVRNANGDPIPGFN